MQAFKTVNDLKTRSSRMKKWSNGSTLRRFLWYREFEPVNGRRHLRHPWKWNQRRASKDGFTASPLPQWESQRERERGKVHRCKYDKSTEGVSDLDVRRRQRPISRGRNVINARDQTEATSCLTYSPLAVPRREPRLKACWIDILITILDSGEWRESF